MQIKFLDLPAEYNILKPQIDSLISEIVSSGEFIGGKHLQAFEKNFSQFSQTKGCVGVGNGTDALEIAIKALALPEKSEIIVPSNTFFASVESILNAGHRAVLVDCDKDYLIDRQALENAITPNTAAIMPVHLYGRACDMTMVMAMAQKYSLKVIEDCSQAHGAKTLYKNELKSVGSIGDMGCFSFYPGKNLGAYGDGGAIVSNDNRLLEVAREIANHGIRNNTKYAHARIGRNSRLDSMQAGILNIKLARLYEVNASRQACAKMYGEALGGLENIILPKAGDLPANNVWHLYVVRLAKIWRGKRKMLVEYLAKNGVACGVHYPQDLGSLEAILQHPDCRVASNQNAKNFASEILSLPIGEHISREEVAYIAEKLHAFAGELAR
ncbi:DegT/DnrJ/EryC1/StrS family aminotransferase [Helicobacter sp. 11S02596-1]|uniref:DegT/DnrJ/EryC1/StrS family aminotransferase n=1 Tax=Helicobacter sp. 11S02596-1 TaxID=1476194 RepID=UPI000BA5D86B|nr:DegT/DnrJ/EryC1/StrS family aminotransferase [Helicobacter sp. 11S02596-1]PAF42781.1 hypothetical protein BJI48_05840 [Helicobacter sp. 11S02596-1]